jgi:Mrp family chromosome partitioning ATPase
MEAARGQKHPSEAENGMKESIYWKKFLMKVAQQAQKPLNGSNQIWATTSGKKDTATSEVTV